VNFPAPFRGTKAQRASTLIEVLMAVVLLVFVFLAWAAAAITASQASNTAAEHTQEISIANALLENVRRDPLFWDEYGPNGCQNPTNCWTVAPGQPCGVGVPPGPGQSVHGYDDQYDATKTVDQQAWQDGYACGNLSNLQNYNGNGQNFKWKFMWRADVKDFSPSSNFPYNAMITIWIYTSFDGRSSVYKVQTEKRLG
jgi:Tfp pilus assembly protein PilV